LIEAEEQQYAPAANPPGFFFYGRLMVAVPS
jgi:hypothetical protein